MSIISKKIETALIEGQTFLIGSEKIIRIIGDFNSDSGLTNSELFMLGVELGRLFQYEVEHSTRGGDFENEIYFLITKIEEKLK